MRWLYFCLGWFFFLFGLIGIVLPLVPTVVNWILATYFFTRCDSRMAAYVLNHPAAGPSVTAFLDHGLISRRGKALAVSGMLFRGAIALFTLWGRWWILPFRLSRSL